MIHNERFRGGLSGRPTRIAGLDGILADLMGAMPDAGVAWLLGPLSRSATAADVEATDHEGRVADGPTAAIVRELAAHAFRGAEREMIWEEGDEGGPREFDSNWTLVRRPYVVHADEGAGSGALEAASRRGAAHRTFAWLATSGAGPGLVAAAGRAMGTGDPRADA